MTRGKCALTFQPIQRGEPCTPEIELLNDFSCTVCYENEPRKRPYNKEIASVPLLLIQQRRGFLKALINLMATFFAAFEQPNSGSSSGESTPADDSQLPQFRRELVSLLKSN